MRTLSLLAAFSLTACLIAPGKPSERHDAGGGGGGDGGGDGGIGPFGSGCLGPDDTAGAALAFDVLGSGNDSLFRGGMQGGQPKVWRFDPPVANSACPSTTYNLATSAPGATSVDALSIRKNTVSFAGKTELFASLTRGSDSYIVAVALDSSATHPAIEKMIASGYAPQPVAFSEGTAGIGYDHPAFIELVDADGALWIGGGSSLGVVPIGTTQHFTGRVLPVLFANDVGSAAAADSYYAVAELSGTDHVALVGGDRSYIMQAPATVNASTVTATIDDYGAHGNCDSSHKCAPRVATHEHPGNAGGPSTVWSVDRNTGYYEDIAGSGGASSHTFGSSPPGGSYRVADAVVDQLVNDGENALTLAELWVDTSTMAVQPPRVLLLGSIEDMQATNPSTYSATSAQLDVNRLIGLHRSELHTFLLLSEHPGAALDAEACVFANTPTSYMPCP